MAPRPNSEPPTSHPPVDPQRALVYSAAGILGSLYVDVQAAATGALRPNADQLRALAQRVAKDGMAASRRLRKAAEAP